MSETISHSVRCRCCNGVSKLKLPASGFFKWQVEGALIQNAMPQLSPDERELLISGTCGTCFDKMFGGME